MFLIFHPAVQSLYSLLNFQVGAKIDQSQRLTSWRGNLLCFSYSRGNVISFTACLVERRNLVNFFALKPLLFARDNVCDEGYHQSKLKHGGKRPRELSGEGHLRFFDLSELEKEKSRTCAS